MATVRYFYIGEIDNANKVQIELSPQLSNTLDESLDNLTVRTIAGNQKNPYTPLTKFFVCDEENNIIQTFLISTDTVEIASTNPLRYIHNLNLVQSSEYLSKHEIRNNVFSNSLESANFNLYVGGRFFYDVFKAQMRVNVNVASIDLTKKKPTSLVFIPDFYAAYQENYWEEQNISTVSRYYDVIQDYQIKLWSDLYKNSIGSPEYPIVHFTINGNTEDWQLGDFGLKERLVVPPSIMNFINHQISIGGTTLQITVTFFTSNGGFIVAPYNAINIPFYGKLGFDIEVSSIEMSVYDCLQLLLIEQMKETDDYNSSNDSKINPLFRLPTLIHNPDLYFLLISTNTPNLVFTQSTMFDALAEIFKIFDATFKIDDEGYLDIEYFNDNAQTKINKPEIAGRNLALSEERFTNKLITYFQNTKINFKFPNSNDISATAYIGSKTLGVPSQSDFVFNLPKPIDIIKRVNIKSDAKVNYMRVSEYDNENTFLGYQFIYFMDVDFFDVIDVTPCIVESSLWSVLPSIGTVNNPYDLKLTKENTLTYERGGISIEIAKYFNITSDALLLNKQISIISQVLDYALLKSLGLASLSGESDITYDYSVPQILDLHSVKLSVEYIALIDGKYVNESIDNKYDGETLINQGNGSIDINKLGLNMVGLGLKLGQPTLNMTQVFSTWDERVRKGNFFIDENNDRWVANNCVYTVLKPDLVQTNIEFVKNFNGLARRIELNHEKRLSSISNELTVKCEETYGEYIYYSSTPFNALESEKIAFNGYTVVNGLLMTLNQTLGKQEIEEFGNIITNYIGIVLDFTSLLTQVKTTQHNLYYISGVTITDYNSSSGQLTVKDTNNIEVIVPKVTTNTEDIIYDEVSGEFRYEDNGSYPQLNVNEDVDMFLIVDNHSQVIAGAVKKYTEIPTILFNEEEIMKVYDINDYAVEYALYTGAYESGEVINNDETGEVKNIAVPMSIYGSGFSIAFEMSFNSPISAGTQLLENSPLWTGGWFNNAVLYTDKDGRADYVTITFAKLHEELTRYYPEMKKTTSTYLSFFTFGEISNLRYYKKPNEVFALNYQLHFMPKNYMSDFLSINFVENNGFAKGLNRKKFHLMTSLNKDVYSILDTKGEGTSVAIDSITPTLYEDVDEKKSHVKILFEATMTSAYWNSIKSWAIVDENNNIYFASNNAPKDNSDLSAGQFAIYFISRHHRLS